MKLQCPCGAKYAFDLAPEMLTNPVSFICPACQADHSAFVNELVRQEFGSAAPVEPPPPPPPPTGSRLTIHHAAKPVAPAPAAAPVSKFCPKHRGVLATEHCAECGKPICPQCLSVFGYFCSPLCKNKADLTGKNVPIYAGKSSEVESRFWRKTGLIFGVLAVFVLSLIGFWGWYQFYGSRPHQIFSVRFEQKTPNGNSLITSKNQLVYLHGSTLARVDLKSRKTVWSQELITKKEYADAIAAESQADSGSTYHTLAATLEKSARNHLERALELSVAGEQIWVARDRKSSRYDWATGNVAETKNVAARLNFGEDNSTEGLPLNPNDDSGKSLDPDKVAAQAQNLKLQGQLALPALLANSLHQRQLLNALKDGEKNGKAPAVKNAAAENTATELVRASGGDLLFTIKLLEQKIATHSAMKAAPKKSALDGEVNQAATMDIANETLNELQRNNGGDLVSEDVSRYQVSVRKSSEPETAGWTGEVVGPPRLHPLKTVNVITAGKGVVVLDAENKKMWTASLTYSVPGEISDAAQSVSQYGEGPCVERGNMLYIFDQAVLTAFELTTGNARWRLPSVGVAGLFFDAQDNVIVNTTTSSPDDIKYSRQIDVTKTTDAIVQKIAAQSGKILWTAKPAGHVSYVAGNIIYATQTYDSGYDPDEDMSGITAGLEKPDYVRIVRLDPKTGRELWVYEDQRAPSSVRFSDNLIQLVFKKEVQVLKYMAF